MRLIVFVFRHIIPIGLIVGIGLVLISAAKPVYSSRINGIGVDLLSSPPLNATAVEEQLTAIQQAGSEYVRIEVNWTWIETSPDTYDWSNVIPLDLFFSSAQTRKIKSVAVVTGFPIYLSSLSDSVDQKTVGERWEKFIQAAVNHFGDQVNYWQIGEEINSTTSSRSLAFADAAFYSKMLRSANKIIKKTNSNDEVWMGSLVSATAINCAVNPLTFMLEIHGAGGWNAADIITYQPRRGPTAPENASTMAINQSCSSSVPVTTASLSDEVQSVQDLVRQLGTKPVYITGLVWSQEELALLQSNRSIDLNTLQSDLLVRGSVILMGTNTIPVIFWQLDPLVPSASMNSLSNLNTLLEDSKPQKQDQGQAANIQEYRFQKGGEINSLAWRTLDGDLAQAVGFSGLVAGKMTAYPVDAGSLDSTTGMVITVDESGTTTVMLNERPVVFVGKAGGWDDQLKAVISDRIDIWRTGIHSSLSDGLGQLKTSLLQWLEGLFNKAKENMVDWGEEQIRGLLN